MTKRWLIGIGALVFVFGGTLPLSYADMSLHGFCWAPTPACSESTIGGQAVTPFDSSNGVNVGFTIGSGPKTGDYLIDILVPDTESSPASLSFSITGDATGTANLFHTSPFATPWTSGFLDNYLGIHSSPANPLGAWLPATQTLDPSATGYFVYQADLGTHTLLSPSCAPCGPELHIDASHHFGGQGALIVGFLNIPGTRDYDATANSGALFDATGGGVVPEPASLLLLGSGLAGLGLWRKLKSQN